MAPFTRRRREIDTSEWIAREHTLGPTLCRLLEEIAGLETVTAIDVGCGRGRLALHLAPRVGRIIGIDLDPSEIELAKKRAMELEFTNVAFSCTDAEQIEYRDLVSGEPVQLVVANLCMSDPIIARTSRALDPGGLFVFEAFHVSQWQETGIPSRFSYREDHLGTLLAGKGFRIDYLGVEEDVLRFRDEEEFPASVAVPDTLREKWEKDGRWSGLIKYFEGGGRRLTVRGRVIVKAVREKNHRP